MLTALRRPILVLSACAATLSCGKQETPQAAEPTDAELMDRGVQALYQKNDPVAAELTFRQVLARKPSHYGAHYQLAVALDRGGKPADARAEWNEVLRQAQAISDSNTMRTARVRLAMPDTASVAAVMVHGLDLMYRQNDPAAAAEQFRGILKRKPTHYGATYQLAVALDRAGQRAQARPLWEKTLGMAVAFKDQTTANTARERLRTP